MTEYSAEDTKWFYLGVAINQLQPSPLRRERILEGLSQFPQGIQIDGNWTVKSSDPDISYMLENKQVKIVNRIVKYAHVKTDISCSYLVLNK